MKRKSERERLKEIIAVFLKHGVKDFFRNNPVGLRLALEELGPTFVKIGQILSTRPDLLPEQFLEELGKLQDNVQPVKFELIEQVIREELQAPPEDVFLSFEKHPLASASLAQVHCAVLKNGENVVVKVQRPGVKQSMLNDIAILRRLGSFIKFTPPGNLVDLKQVADELWEAAVKELDFLQEAQNINLFRENNKEIRYLTCPHVFEDYTTSRLLIMEKIEGIKIIDATLLERKGYDPEEIARKLAYNYCKQIFEDGFFHADPHPGNILVCGGKIAYLDFGLMGVLSKGLREQLNFFLYGVATKNLDVITEAVLGIGIKQGSIRREKLYSDLEVLTNQYLSKPLSDLELPRLMDEIFKTAKNNNLAIPASLTMIVKGLITLEGVAAKLAPELNLMDVAVPYVRELLLKQRDYRRDLLEQLDDIYFLAKNSLKFPLKLNELVNSVVAGKTKLQLEHVNLEHSLSQLNRMVNRIVFGLVLAALIIGSSVVVNSNLGPKIYNLPIIGVAGYFGAAVMGFWLLISILRSGKM